MVEPHTECMLASVTVPLRIDAVTADISAIDLDDMVILTTADQIATGHRPDLEPDSSLQAAGVDHEATACRCTRGNDCPCRNRGPQDVVPSWRVHGPPRGAHSSIPSG